MTRTRPHPLRRAPTVRQFKRRFPEFGRANSRTVRSLLAQAAVEMRAEGLDWGERWEEGVGLLAAHKLTTLRMTAAQRREVRDRMVAIEKSACEMVGVTSVGEMRAWFAAVHRARGGAAR